MKSRPRKRRRLTTTLVAERHNELKLTEALDTRLRPFWERGVRVILADRFAIALQRQLRDTVLAQLPLVGSVDQWVDSTDVLASAHRARVAAQALLQLER
jgi:hypothetical protein